MALAARSTAVGYCACDLGASKYGADSHYCLRRFMFREI